jgi:hypothetical protein
MADVVHFLGIDPGKQGAFAILSTSGDLLSIIDMPICDKQPSAHGVSRVYLAMQKRYNKTFTVIEKPQFRPTDGKKGIASYHLAAGYLLMPLLWDWPIQMVPPQVWTRLLHVGQPSEFSAKTKSKAAFQALFPKLAGSKAFIDNKKVYDGRIDAVLIAEYARRLYSGIAG